MEMEIDSNTHGSKLPDIYVMSKLPNLVEELKKNLPSDVNLKFVEVADKRMRFDTSIKVEPEEIAALQKAEILVVDSMFLAKTLYHLPNLKWAQCTWTGVEMIFDFVDRSKPNPNFTLTRYVDPYLGELMSNYVIAQIINIERDLYGLREKQLLGQWARPYFPNFRVLSDLTIGILGAGKLGSAVAKLLKSAGAKVISFTKNAGKHISMTNNLITTELSVILEKSDYICNVLPSTAGTRGMLDGNAFQMCKKKPVFINIGRGDIAKEDTIIRALNDGLLSLAVLDVFEIEPLPGFSPLWKMPKVILTPHIGAIPRISESAKLIAENYSRYVQGKEMLNLVDWNKGY